jgi:hypothetical protein
MTLVYLIASPKQTGYLSAMRKTWGLYDSELETLPSKSSLSDARSEISFEFFRESYEEQVSSIRTKLPKIKGLRLYAVDGDQLELPASEDILSYGYRGFSCKNGKETHYPRMYYTTKVEVFSGIVTDVRESIENDECKNAVDMAATTECGSITLYDRLHFSLKLANAHKDSKSFYIARLKVGSRVLMQLQEFVQSKRKVKLVCIDGLFIRFLRVKNHKTGEWMYLATNLPRSFFKIREIQWLYWRRYDIETVFRDLTATHSLGVWHSTKLNGILQEFYLQFYIHNCSRFLILSGGGIEVIKDIKTGEYRRPNLKLIREYFLDNMKLLLNRQVERLHLAVKFLIQKSMESRIFFSRLSPRQVKYAKNTYKSASLVPQRA